MSEPGAPDRVSCFPRSVATISAVVVIGISVFSLVMWFALPDSLRATFTPFQIITLILVLVVIAVVLGATSASRVVADADGLRFRNGLRSHDFGWEEVRRIDYQPGDPWAFVWIRPHPAHPEGVRYLLLGIQRSDGPRADRAVAALRDLYRRYG